MPTITLTNLTYTHPGAPTNLFQNITLTLNTTWKLGLIGRNGKGKTTLLKLLHNPTKSPHQGTITTTTQIDYFPFDIPNKTQTPQQIITQIAPNAEEWEIAKELNLLRHQPGNSPQTLQHPKRRRTSKNPTNQPIPKTKQLPTNRRANKSPRHRN